MDSVRIVAPARLRLAASAAAALVLIGPAAALSAEGDSHPAPSSADFASLMATPHGGETSGPEPTTATERAESELAFADLSDAEALDLAKAEFKDLIEADLVPELHLQPGEEVAEYLGPSTALIEEPDAPEGPEDSGPGLLVESSTPLRAPEHGAPEPLDGELVAQGDHYEAENAPVEAELPVDLEEGIELPASDLTVAPIGTDPTQPVEAGEVLFYPNAEIDVDVMLAPSATGAALFLQLRSVESPERFPLDVGTPAGAVVESSSDGGALIRSAGKVIASVSAPVAWDAAGVEVPTHYEFHGDRLEIVVDHRIGDYLRPIAVDPVITDYYPWGQGQSSPNYDMWQPVNLDPARWSTFYHTNDGGLMNRATGGTYGTGSFAEWLATPIRSSFVERMDFFNYDRRPTSPGACTVLGIWNGTGWATGTAVDASSGNTQYNQPYIQQCDNVAHDTRYFWVGNSPTPDGYDNAGDVEAATGAAGVFALTSFAGSRSAPAENVLRSANVYRFDRNLPAATPPTAGWTNDPVVTVSDQGLGGKSVSVWEGSGTSGPFIGSYVDPCTGAHQAPCPVNAGIHAQLPEGRRAFTAYGYDAIGWWSAPLSFNAKVDRTPPAIGVTGSLVDAASSTTPLTADPYGLTVTATDQAAGTGAGAERSGVSSVSVTLDGAQVSTVSQPCTTHSCPLQQPHTWAMNAGNISQGWHELVVRVADHAGNVNERRFDFWSTPQLGGADVERYPGGGVRFGDAQFRVLQGTPGLQGGCVFANEDDVSLSDRTYGTDTQAFEASSCRIVARVGVLASNDVVRRELEDVEAVANRPSSEAPGSKYVSVDREMNAEGGSGDSACCGRLIALGHTRWEDPPSLNVAEVHTQIRWNPGRNCSAINGTQNRWITKIDYFEESGWSKDYDLLENGANCERIENRVEAAFKNTLFCNPLSTTTVTIRPNRLRALADGKAKLNWEANSWGDCANLLDFEHRLIVKPLN